jgi:hypothetical protein
MKTENTCGIHGTNALLTLVQVVVLAVLLLTLPALVNKVTAPEPSALHDAPTAPPAGFSPCTGDPDPGTHGGEE